MSFWKKIYKKLVDKEKENPKKLVEDKYLQKLKEKLSKYK
jgi:hypothetical protein